MMRLSEKVRQAGVVGAGGAGFPTHRKLQEKADWYLANGAECEPLVHKDVELMSLYPGEIIHGLRLAAETVGARQLTIGIKAKNSRAIQALKSAAGDEKIGIHEMGDFYPSGDEYELVYSVTGRLIPAGGIPLEIGVVVSNVETLYQIYQASLGIPVTETFMSITGCVAEPFTAWIPVGMRISEILKLAGDTTVRNFAVMESGLLMGRPVEDLAAPVSKTTAGLIILPASHNLVERYTKPYDAMARIGKSACDQCSYCTELCPRYLLGYDVQPHAVMRSLGFSTTGSEIWNQYALLCCGCGICTLYACPEALYPREACLAGIKALKTAGRRWEGPREVKVHPMKEFRRVPMGQLMVRLGVDHLQSEAPYRDVIPEPERVILPLDQMHSGNRRPLVRVGQVVEKGQIVAEPEDQDTGSLSHASISGRVVSVEKAIQIQKG